MGSSSLYPQSQVLKLVGQDTNKTVYSIQWILASRHWFVAAVEFGDRIEAKSILAGGISGDPDSPHFDDQAEMYSKGIFKDVLFYRTDIEPDAKRTYNPGK